jgi:hypothetical protein
MISLRKELQRMDPNLKPDDDAFNAALVLLAAADVGTNADKIAKRARISRSLSRKIVVQATEAGIFAKGKLLHGGWFDKKTGGVAFWLDVACVCGWLKRA